MPESTTTALPNLLVRTSLNLLNASKGVYLDTSSSLSGVVGSLDFAGEPVKKYVVSGSLTGSFTYPPANIPSLTADGQRVLLTIEFHQDSTGGRTINLDTLFANYKTEVNADSTVYGLPVSDEAPYAVTVVDILIRRESGANKYSVGLSPTISATQIVDGVISQNRLPVASTSVTGIIGIGSGSGGAAAGNHIHEQMFSKTLSVERSTGLLAGDYVLEDLPAAGRIVRVTRMQFTGGTSPTATVSIKLSGQTVTGTGVTVTNALGTDANATASNTFVARQLLQVSIAGTAGVAVTGNPTVLSGMVHYALNNSPWTP